MSAENFGDILREAYKTGETDKPAAIQKLEEHKHHAHFFPWGAHTLVHLYLAVGKTAEARPYATAISERDPAFAPSWWGQLSLLRGTPRFLEICKSILEIRRIGTVPPTTSMADPTLQATLAVRPSDFRKVLKPFLDENLISLAQFKAVSRLVYFLDAAGAIIQRNCLKDSCEYWRLGISNRDKEAYIEDNCVVLNLACLDICSLDGFSDAAQNFIIAVSAMFDWAPYSDDAGVNSWDKVGKEDCYTAIFWQMAVNPLRWLHIVPEGSPGRGKAAPMRHPNFDPMVISPGGSRLFVRPGRVELRAIWALFDGYSAAQTLAAQVADQAVAAANSGGNLTADEKASWANYSNNIIRLMTNAGWYALPKFAGTSFLDWADRYQKSLIEGTILAIVEADLLPVRCFRPEIGNKKPVRFSEDTFLAALKDQNVAFVTAFADEIGESYASGALRSLWEEKGLDFFINSLDLVEAPMSVWPYFPDNSWSETFSKLATRCKELVASKNITTFIAACGAYGLPLVQEIHKEFGILSIYNGHLSNLYFGIATQAEAEHSFFRSLANSPHWRKPNLAEKFPTVSRIDEGRYVGANKS